MNNNKSISQAIPSPLTIQQKLGTTTYQVDLHFCQTGTETMLDKVQHLLKQEILSSDSPL